MSVPEEIKRAISELEGAKLALVLGAGCSFEKPPGLPLSGDLSEAAHTRLVDDGVLEAGECPTPRDLTAVGDAVFAKCDEKQEKLVERMNPHRMRSAAPNDGYLLAAALLSERALKAVMTLNYDLAMSIAHAQVGSADTVGIVNGPESIAEQRTTNIYYLHRNVDSPVEEWIIRTPQLEMAWEGGWEQIVAGIVLASPQVIFAGLGSPAKVLEDTTERIRAAFAQDNIYQADICPHDESYFADKLEIPVERYIKLGWTDLMRELGNRLATEHLRLLRTAVQQRAAGLVFDNGVTELFERLSSLGLLGLGKLRAEWLLAQGTNYRTHNPNDVDLLADVAIGIACLAEHAGGEMACSKDGLVTLKVGDQMIAIAPVSGRGTTSLSEIETSLRNDERDSWRSPLLAKRVALVAATATLAGQVALPEDIVQPPQPAVGDVLQGGGEPLIVRIEELRANPEQTVEVIVG